MQNSAVLFYFEHNIMYRGAFIKVRLKFLDKAVPVSKSSDSSGATTFY